MSTFSYASVALTPCRTLGERRDVRHDSGKCYLWTEITLTVEGVFNPQLTSYTYQGNVQNFQASPGSNPAFTDSVVRHILSQPRQKLVYTAADPGPDGQPVLTRDGLNPPGGSLLVLDVPPATNDNPPDPTGNPSTLIYDTDCNNGPEVLGLTVVPMGGKIRTWFVRMTVRVCLNECFNYYSSPCVLLSHRWTMTHNLDRDYLCTRTVRGHALFRSDALRAVAKDVQVDDYRQAIGHPVPVGFKRELVSITPSEDGNRIDYVFVDREQLISVVAPNVSRIEGYVTVSEFGGDVGKAIWTIFLGWLTGPKSGGSGAGRGAARAAAGDLPSSAFTVVIRVWGLKGASQRDLIRTAEAIASIKLPTLFRGNGMPVAIDVVSDFMGRFCEYRATMSSAAVIGGFNALIAGAGTQGIADRLAGPIFEDEAPGYLTALPTGPGPQPSQSGGTRGSYVAVAVAQALQQPCAKPPAPSTPRTAVDRAIADPQR